MTGTPQLQCARSLCTPESYTPDFFAGLHESALDSAQVIVPLVLGLTRAASVIDVGCGTGTWLAVFAANGVRDILGVDGDYVQRTSLEIPPEHFITHDLRTPLRLDRRFDLVVSLEVAEHLPEAAADAYVDSLVRLGPVVLFSAAVPHQGGTNHVNEQWPEFWADKFLKHGLVVADAIRPMIWDHPAVAPWYAQNTLVFAQASCLARLPGLRAAARATRRSRLAMIHPRIFSELSIRASSDRRKGDYYYAETLRLEDRVRDQEATAREFTQEIATLRSCLAAEQSVAAAPRLEHILVALEACQYEVAAVTESLAQSSAALDESHLGLQSSCVLIGQLDAQLQLQHAQLSDLIRRIEAIETEHADLAAELDRRTAELNHWKAAADLPSLPLRTLLNGIWRRIRHGAQRGTDAG